jgi:hypothetical protein
MLTQSTDIHMTTAKNTSESEPLPTAQAIQQSFDPEDAAPPSAADIVLEVFLGILSSGPGVKIGRPVRSGLGRPPLRPSPPRTGTPSKPLPASVSKPASVQSPLKATQKFIDAVKRVNKGGLIKATDDLAGSLIAHSRPRLSRPGQNEGGFLDALLQQRANSNARGPGQLETVAEITSLDFQVPDRVYRGHIGNTVQGASTEGLQRATGTRLEGDDYLAAIIKHSARQGGSNGEVLSLSAEKTVATKFAKGRRAPVFEIDTTQDPKAFRTINDILLNDAERLVIAGKVTRATVLKAVDNIALHRESELFYVKGDIPATYLTPEGRSL